MHSSHAFYLLHTENGGRPLALIKNNVTKIKLSFSLSLSNNVEHSNERNIIAINMNNYYGKKILPTRSCRVTSSPSDGRVCKQRASVRPPLKFIFYPKQCDAIRPSETQVKISPVKIAFPFNLLPSLSHPIFFTISLFAPRLPPLNPHHGSLSCVYPCVFISFRDFFFSFHWPYFPYLSFFLLHSRVLARARATMFSIDWTRSTPREWERERERERERDDVPFVALAFRS